MLTDARVPPSSHPNECVAAVVVKLPVKLSTPEALARNAQEATETKSRLFTAKGAREKRLKQPKPAKP